MSATPPGLLWNPSSYSSTPGTCVQFLAQIFLFHGSHWVRILLSDSLFSWQTCQVILGTWFCQIVRTKAHQAFVLMLRDSHALSKGAALLAPGARKLSTARPLHLFHWGYCLCLTRDLVRFQAWPHRQINAPLHGALADCCIASGCLIQA
jgi:hypothetical protein